MIHASGNFCEACGWKRRRDGVRAERAFGGDGYQGYVKGEAVDLGFEGEKTQRHLFGLARL